MKIFLYFLTMVFGIVCFVIMKKKRYKVMPLICLIMFICFIGCGFVSLVYSFVPYGDIFVMPLVSIVFGLIFILVGVNDLYSLLCCGDYREQTTQNISHKRLNKGMTQGKVYRIYIDPKHPAVFILAKKIKIGTIVAIILGLFLFTGGIDFFLLMLSGR